MIEFKTWMTGLFCVRLSKDYQFLSFSFCMFWEEGMTAGLFCVQNRLAFLVVGAKSPSFVEKIQAERRHNV